ncbi:DUF3667 domain-containing protein [Muricauda sp. JGD-17]|uniref:DUF3667 domain-containing protein n=1 Tax=Flagellimonas ochracea TaxID=2696472 RepID=A0A964TE42_9FLAO|nr:DUF3667 domain-containing protein [Allomuricauda ochracea]NAY92451.1 DUF3667 domain-containing protein [Allomuricauda ochracea]
MGKKNGLISKGRYELKFRGTECLNCGHILDISDKYCPNCSQANSTKKLVLKDFFDEFFSSLINYDSKLLKTLYSLLLRPGSITKDYVLGKRVTYTNPFRFLLSLAFLYFLMFSYNNSFSSWDKAAKSLEGGPNNSNPFSFDMSTGKISADNAEIQKQAEKALLKLDSLGAKNAEVVQTMEQLDSLGVFEANIQEIERDSLMLADPRGYFQTIKHGSGVNGLSSKMEFFSNMIRHDGLESFDDSMEKYGVDNTLNNKMAFNFSSSLLKVIRQPGSFINATLSKLPFVIFFFLPIFAVFISLVYIRKKYTYTDHLIFSFHNQSLLFILLLLSLIIDTIFDTSTAGIFLLVFGIYLYKAMRKFYGQGRFKTILKYLFLNTVFTILALFAVIMLLTGSVFTY